MTSYSRPVGAKLYVHLDNGEKFEAKPEDLANFGYVDKLDVYMRFDARLAKVLMDAGLIEREKHITDTKLNVVRHLVEVAINYPDLLDHPEMADEYAQIVEIERALRAANVPAEA
jgi:hypothetical protein